MSELRTSSCRSCGARIIWSRTERGNKMPLDAEPIANEHWRNWTGGTMFVLRDHSSSEGPLAISAWGLEGTEPHYVSHFATCPQADEHRRG